METSLPQSPPTFEQLKAEVIRLIKASPDNVYQKGHYRRCWYSKGVCTNGTEGCVWGQALRSLGIVIPVGYDGVGIITLLEHLRVPADDDEQGWAEKLQGIQDGGVTWGEALRRANEAFPEVA